MKKLNEIVSMMKSNTTGKNSTESYLLTGDNLKKMTGVGNDLISANYFPYVDETYLIPYVISDWESKQGK